MNLKKFKVADIFVDREAMQIELILEGEGSEINLVIPIKEVRISKPPEHHNRWHRIR